MLLLACAFKPCIREQSFWECTRWGRVRWIFRSCTSVHPYSRCPLDGTAKGGTEQEWKSFIALNTRAPTLEMHAHRGKDKQVPKWILAPERLETFLKIIFLHDFFWVNVEHMHRQTLHKEEEIEHTQPNATNIRLKDWECPRIAIQEYSWKAHLFGWTFWSFSPPFFVFSINMQSAIERPIQCNNKTKRERDRDREIDVGVFVGVWGVFVQRWACIRAHILTLHPKAVILSIHSSVNRAVNVALVYCSVNLYSFVCW